MMVNRKQWIKLFLSCFICNGALIAIAQTGASRTLILGSGVILTLGLWLLMIYTTRETVDPPSFGARSEPICEPDKSLDMIVRFLSALQREGRLIDFLHEDLASYGDEQIGAAVRSIHLGCKNALKDYATIEPVLAEQEGAVVTVPIGFDTTSIRLTGNVTGNPPFRGVLRHRGWKIAHFCTSEGEKQKGNRTLTPAEIEMG